MTADANRNLYQAGFTKHVAMMCTMLKASGQKKSLVVVAVSSPYDFAMDKSIGTYICTFDFTETAMQSLVRALYGEYTPQGSMPGTMRKSKKISKKGQQWLVEEYQRERDSRGLDDLLKSLARSSTSHVAYAQSSAHTFEVFNANTEERHFVVRNSSTRALYGFAATYSIHGTGYLGAIFVDPSKRNVSIGRSLHRRAVRALVSCPGVKRVQLGFSFPGLFPGVPIDEGANLRDWFSNIGWDTSFTRRLTDLVIDDLPSWSAPDGLLPSIQRAGISFDLLHGLDNAESVLSYVAANAGAELVELYRFALQDTKMCGVVRAKDQADNLLGTVIICKVGSNLSAYLPMLSASNTGADAKIGGIAAPVVPLTTQSTLTLQGLIVMALRQNKASKMSKSVLSWVSLDRNLWNNDAIIWVCGLT